MKSRLLLLASIFTLFFGALFLSSHQEVSFADDDDEEHDEKDEEDEEDEEDEKDDDTEDKKERSDSTVKTPETTALPITTTTTQTTVTTLNDSDGDGLYDNEDPHPDIPEFIIVNDDNKNGIVDTFEENSG